MRDNELDAGESRSDQPPEIVLRGFIDDVKRITAEIESHVKLLSEKRSTKQPQHLETIQALLQDINHTIDRYKDYLNNDDSSPEA